MAVKARKWVFTLNNYTEEEEKQLKGVEANYIVMGREVGESGTKHLQGYIEFENPRAMGGVKKVLGKRAHIEQAKGTAKQAADYCKKDGEYWEKGTMSIGRGHRTDLDELGERILKGERAEAIAESNPGAYVKYHRGLKELAMTVKPKKWREVKTLVYWGPTGTGKTRKAMEEESVYKLNTNSNGRLWFDGYEGESVLLLDDYYGWIRYGELLTILDGYPYRCEIKGGHTWARWEKVIITSNEEPEKWYRGIELSALKRRINETIHFKGGTEVGTGVGGNTNPHPTSEEKGKEKERGPHKE